MNLLMIFLDHYIVFQRFTSGFQIETNSPMVLEIELISENPSEPE